MEQRLSLITLGVADLSRARAFYEALALWSRAQLAVDSGVDDPGGWGGVRCEVAHNPRWTVTDDGATILPGD